MRPQLNEIVQEFREASNRLHRLSASMREDQWNTRPAPESWSAGECIAHLNLTSEAFLPVLREGLEQAKSLDGAAPRRYRRDPLGWLLWRTMGPPARIRAKTSVPFIPVDPGGMIEAINHFDRLQEEQIQFVAQADGLPLQKVRIASPFNSRAKYNLFSCLSILPRHQLRHLWQAERAYYRLLDQG